MTVWDNGKPMYFVCTSCGYGDWFTNCLIPYRWGMRNRKLLCPECIKKAIEEESQWKK